MLQRAGAQNGPDVDQGVEQQDGQQDEQQSKRSFLRAIRESLMQGMPRCSAQEWCKVQKKACSHHG
jgi:hypothetical protein